MEQGLNSYLREYFNTGDIDIKTYSPLTLAYIGDTVFDIVVRSLLVNRGNTKVEKLHARASSIVKATSQSAMIRAIMDDLTPEEMDIYKRGRNSKPHTKAKNATTVEYLDATGFEAIAGYLYLLDNWDRICELIKLGMDRCDLWSQLQ